MVSELRFLHIICFIALIIISTTTTFYFHSIFAAPLVQVSPPCGPADPGFNLVINANGFAPNSNVNWKFVSSKGQIPLYGYFQTNSTGGFNDVTYADDVKPDNYKMYFGTDSNNDNKFDAGTPIVYANITIPCP